jgi:hypothetical protein
MLRVLLASIAGLTALHWAAPASACGPLPPSLSGRPSDGDTNVPTDVIPIYYEDSASFDVNRLPASHFVLTSPTGEVIETTPTHRDISIFELRPERTLSPNTKYSLRGTWTVPASAENRNGTTTESLVFTSAEGPYGKVPAAPVAGVQHYLLNDIDHKLLGAGSCIFYQGNLLIEATFFAAGKGADAESAPRLYFGAFYDNLSGIMQDTDYDCVRLRSRAPNGDLGAPTVLCRKDGPLLTLTQEIDAPPCTSEGIRPGFDAGAEPPSDATTDGSAGRSPEYSPESAASCSVVGVAHAPPSSAWGMLAGLSLVTAWCARRGTRHG